MAQIRTRWRPPAPLGDIIKVVRTADGVEEVAFVGYIAETTPDGDHVHVRAEGPEGLLGEMPLVFEPPLVELADDREGYEFWWRQIQYVFDLRDPRLAPPLRARLAPHDVAVVQQYVRTTRDLAESDVISAVGGVEIKIDDDTDEEHVVADFPKRDLQSGFSTLLRQCQGPSDEARFDVVFELLRRAVAVASDEHAPERREQLLAWHNAVTRLRDRSLNQLVRDRLVAEEGWKVWDYQEATEPQELIRIVNYGDLIHWGSTRGSVIAAAEDEYASARQRSEFFNAALGLAHLSVGFGELARALTVPISEIWLP